MKIIVPVPHNLRLVEALARSRTIPARANSSPRIHMRSPEWHEFTCEFGVDIHLCKMSIPAKGTIRVDDDKVTVVLEVPFLPWCFSARKIRRIAYAVTLEALATRITGGSAESSVVLPQQIEPAALIVRLSELLDLSEAELKSVLKKDLAAYADLSQKLCADMKSLPASRGIMASILMTETAGHAAQYVSALFKEQMS